MIKNNLEKDDKDRKRQTRDEQVGKGKESSQRHRQMEVVYQGLIRHRV